MNSLNIVIVLCLLLSPVLPLSAYEIAKKGIFHKSLPITPKVLNPLIADDVVSSGFSNLFWTNLMELDHNTLKYHPALADKVEVSSDKKTYKVFLNKKAKWQDGSLVTSKDAEFTYNTIMNPKNFTAVLRTYLSGMKFRYIDKITFELSFEKPNFNTYHSIMGLFVIIQKKQYEKEKNFNNASANMNPIGNGPYSLKTLRRGDRVILTRNKNWWGYELSYFKNRYNFDELVFKIISDTKLEYEKFLKKEIDYIDFTNDIDTWVSKVEGVDKGHFEPNGDLVKVKASNDAPKSYHFIGWNEKKSLFNSKNVRTALSHAVDYNRIINDIYKGMYVQAISPFGTFGPNTSPKIQKNKITYNLKVAYEILKKEGWFIKGSKLLKQVEKEHPKKLRRSQKQFEFDLLVNTENPARLKVAQLLQNDFGKIGIKMNVVSVQWNVLLDRVSKREFDAVLLGWAGGLFPNPRQLWHSKSDVKGGSNIIGYSNKEVDSLIENANHTFDLKKHQKILQKISEIIYEDQPYTFLVETKYYLEGLNPRIDAIEVVEKYAGSALTLDLLYLKK